MPSPPFRAAGALLTPTPAYPTTSGNVAVPAGVADGDFLLLVIRTLFGNVTVTPPSGWTLVASSFNTTSAFNSKCLVYRRSASSEPANYAVSVSGGADANAHSFIAQILAWQDATFESDAGLVAGSGSTGITIPSLTMAGTERTLIAIYGQQGNGGYTGPYTAPGTMTERTDQVDSFGISERTSFSVSDQAIAASGETGTRTATASGSSTWHQAISVAIAPTGGSTPGPGTAPWRPNADVTLNGWTTSSGTDRAALINESADDTGFTSYIVSPAITSTPARYIVSIKDSTGALAAPGAGTYSIRIRMRTTTGSATARVFMLNDSNVSQGVTADFTISTSNALYTRSITTTGTATRFGIEVVQ